MNNLILPATPPTPPSNKEMLEMVLRHHLDTVARQHGYDNITTAVSYVSDPHPKYAAEGLAFQSWRSAVWVKTEEILAEGNILTGEEFLAKIPALVL